MKVIVSNILGVAVGIIVFIICTYLFTYLFGLLLMIPFVSNLLSYPTTPTLYAAVGINCGAAFLSLAACNKVCLPSLTGKKIGYIIFDLLIIASVGYLLISNLQYGINDSMLSFIFVIVICFSSLKSGFDNL